MASRRPAARLQPLERRSADRLLGASGARAGATGSRAPGPERARDNSDRLDPTAGRKKEQTLDFLTVLV